MLMLRIPGNTTNVSDNWRDHIARGSLGGTDFTDAYGTPIHAQADGVVTIVDNGPDGSGGRYVRVTFADGNSTECLHASSIIAYRGQVVRKGDVIGYSGASAFGSNYGTGGPHIHCHAIAPNGVRFNVEPYIEWSGSTSPAGGNATPIEQVLKALEEDMYTIITRNDGKTPWIVLALGCPPYGITGQEGKEKDGVDGKDRNVGGVVAAAWRNVVNLNGTDFNTVTQIFDNMNKSYYDNLAAELKKRGV